MLDLPLRFNRNKVEVQQMGTPAETGRWLIEYMAERLGVQDFGQMDILDFGCGGRFSESFINLKLPIRTYTGIDVGKDVIEYLDEHVEDPRFNYHSVNFRNQQYNRTGDEITESTRLPVGGRKYDLICMFSVATHLAPDEALGTFQVLRKAIRPEGRLFFSLCFTDEFSQWGQLFPENPDHLVGYAPAFMNDILEKSGWRQLSMEGKDPRGLPIMDSLVCMPI